MHDLQDSIGNHNIWNSCWPTDVVMERVENRNEEFESAFWLLRQQQVKLSRAYYEIRWASQGCGTLLPSRLRIKALWLNVRPFVRVYGVCR